MWNSEVKFYANTRFTSPQHRPTWVSKAARDSFMESYVVKQITSSSHVSLELPYRVAGNYNDLISIDMISFVNSDFSNRRVYARVDSKRWINANTCEFTLALDPWITFQHDMYITGAFVEREHVNNDWNGNVPGSGMTLLPEPIPAGVSMAENLIIIGTFTDIIPVLFATSPPTGNQDVEGVINDGVYYPFFNGSGLSQINSLLSEYNKEGKIDAVTAIVNMPRACYTKLDHDIEFNLPVKGTALNGYVPKNSKCLTYPYCSTALRTGQGQVSVLKHELFYGWEHISQAVHVKTTFGISPTVSVWPMVYAGAVNAHPYGVQLSNFPQSAWVNDVFANWFAQNIASSITKIGSGLAVAGVGMATGNLFATAGGAITAFSGAVDIAEAGVKPDVSQGMSDSAACVNNGQYWIDLVRMTTKDIRSVDDFFNAFGYSVCKTKAPAIRTRKLWNHVKTSNCSIGGSFNWPYKKEITDMFNEGVTLWHMDRGATIGDYSGDNSEVGVP